MEYIRGGMKGDPPGIESVEGASELLNPDKPESTPAPTASPETPAPAPSPIAIAPIWSPSATAPTPAAVTPVKTKPAAKTKPVASAPGKYSRSGSFNQILSLAQSHGGFKFPEVVAAQAMHETGWMDPGRTSVYNNTGKTNPFGQTGDRGYGTIPRKGFKDGWTLYPEL